VSLGAHWRTACQSATLSLLAIKQIQRSDHLKMTSLYRQSPQNLLVQKRSFFSLPSFGAKEFKDTKVVKFTQKEVYDLVANVENYPKFLPFVSESRIVSSRDSGNDSGGTEMEAQLGIRFGPMEEKYTSHVCLYPTSITATSKDSSIFSELTTEWTFEPVDDTRTKVGFYIKFGFNNPLYAQAADLVFDKVSNQVLNAFESRCQEVYGKPASMKLAA
jgi:ribosome-associated toxin RatA of RatAB toxin-antitoxin module